MLASAQIHHCVNLTMVATVTRSGATLDPEDSEDGKRSTHRGPPRGRSTGSDSRSSSELNTDHPSFWGLYYQTHDAHTKEKRVMGKCTMYLKDVKRDQSQVGVGVLVTSQFPSLTWGTRVGKVNTICTSVCPHYCRTTSGGGLL